MMPNELLKSNVTSSSNETGIVNLQTNGESLDDVNFLKSIGCKVLTDNISIKQ